MDRHELILAALAATGENVTFTPVQLQKLFFIVDKEAPHLFDGPHFAFAPYDYGPFDKTVYDELDTLSLIGKARIESTGRYRRYGLSKIGYREGITSLSILPTASREYLSSLAGWIKSQNFEQLVSSIYKRYPEMKVNSVFRG